MKTSHDDSVRVFPRGCLGIDRWVLMVASFLALVGGPGFVAAQYTPARSLADLSIEELMNETITSVSKREQRLSDAASAITVLTNDDIRRTGATNIWDAFRVVPGLHVATVKSGVPAVSARGFNGVFANKLLVLVDGRPVYTPLFAGVFWYLQRPMLEDVDRVEIIKGPGATVWGANAVNGVINIEGRSARDTQGGLIYGGGGDVHETMAGIRYGGTIDEKTFYRVSFTRTDQDSYTAPTTGQRDASWTSWHAGARVDRYSDENTHLTLLAGVTDLKAEIFADARNFNALSRWTRNLPFGSQVEFQAFYDRNEVLQPDLMGIKTDTFDLDAQHTMKLGEQNILTWGVGARWTHDALEETSFVIDVRADAIQNTLLNVFVQDEWELQPDRLSLTAGAKLEHDEFTGWELQPSVRALFKPAAHHNFWAAISRAVRSPSETEVRPIAAALEGGPVVGPDGGLYLPRGVGNGDVKSEVLWAYELGYRYLPARNFSVDLATFYNEYSGLIGPSNAAFYPGMPFGLLELSSQNTLDATTYGGEVTMTMDLSENWRLSASYSRFLSRVKGLTGTDLWILSLFSPSAQASLRSSMQLPGRTSLDAQVRYVGAVEQVSSYLTGDVRLSFRPSPATEVALVGQNLFQSQHEEIPTTSLFSPTNVPRGFYGKITWRF